MKVREIMSEPVQTTTPDTWISQAARVMRTADCGILPVVDSDGHIEGVVTDRDICLAIAASNRSPRAIRVHEVMTHKVTVARVDDDVPTALAELKRAHVRRLPVLDASGRVAGLLSLEDIVLRGLQTGAVSTAAIVDTLRALYERLPAPVELNGTMGLGG
jgi:CBS domain-containing protein